jgi:hypothetical protein
MKRILFFLCIAAVGISSSCSHIYDNIKDFATEEAVYVGMFDGAVARAGFERVEIDIATESQMPSGEIKLGKAKKTVVEYDSTVITYDSVRSWVNITGLKTPKMYRFYIYNIDEYGNKSIPVQATAIPYTKTDLDALVLASPLQNVSPTTAELSWPNGLASTFFEMASVTFNYNDRDGVQSYTTTESAVRLTNLVAGAQVPVQVLCSIIPRINNNPIIDTIVLDRSVVVTLLSPEDYLSQRVARSVNKAAITWKYAGYTDDNGNYMGISNGFGTVTWGDVTDHLAASEVRYTTNAGVETVSQILASESSLTCPDAKLGSTVETRSLFIPTGTSDTFATAWVLYEYPFMDEYYRLTWYSNNGIQARFGYHNWWDGLGGYTQNLIDGNWDSGWHSNIEDESYLPQCVVFDLKYTLKIDYITIVAHKDKIHRYLQDIEVYLSDTPMDAHAETVPEPSWGAPQARVRYNLDHHFEHINLAPGSSGRYLALIFPNSAENEGRGKHISFMELYAYGIPD